MIIAVGNTKGGVGKTTIAVNLAVLRAQQGHDVLLVDGDEQGSAGLFTSLRASELGGSPGYTAVPLVGEALLVQTRRLAPKYDDVIIDVGGRDTGSLRAAMIVADCLLVPVQPRTLDVWALDQVVALLKLARVANPKLRAIAFLNLADAQGGDNAEARAIMADAEGIELGRVIIVRRKAFPNAGSSGRGVVEVTPRDPKAIEELTALASLAFS